MARVKLQALIDDRLMKRLQEIADTDQRSVSRMTEIVLARALGDKFIHLTPEGGNQEK